MVVENVPPAQETHSLEEMAPNLVLYVPGAQEMQLSAVLLPYDDRYVPAGHFVQF